jgi:NhaP-type Na+/H+ or K+/H+ antiporter
LFFSLILPLITGDPFSQNFLFLSQGELLVVWLLLISIVIATYLIQRYRISSILPPSSSALVIGIIFGIASRIAGLANPLRFSPAAFFYALLPPIVFSAGFTLKKRGFFQNIAPILTLAILGTVLSTITFALGTYFLVLIGLVRRSHLGGSPFVECLMYGAAISSIDPVATLAVLAQVETPPLLHFLIFGESVLNDAIAIVLFRALSSYSSTHTGVGITTLPAVALKFCVLAAGSLVVGVGVALACAFLLKRFEAYYSSNDRTRSGSGGIGSGSFYSQTREGLMPQHQGNQQHNRTHRGDGGGDGGGGGDDTNLIRSTQSHSEDALDPTLYEIAIVVMGSYLAYLVAEVLGFSGIVALFFTGIVHAHYSHYNVSSDARIALKRVFDVAAFLCELFVFAYLGLQVATNNHSWDFGLIISGIPLAIGSRAANIFPCCRLINKYSTSKKLPKNLQNMLWAVGLRGAVAYGLVVNMPRTDKPGTVGIPAIETAALLIVVVSTLLLGSGTGPLLRYFNLEGCTDEEIYAAGWAEEGPVGQQQPPAELSRSVFHEKFKEIDETMLKPLFGGRAMGGERNTGFDGFYDQDDDNDDVERFSRGGGLGNNVNLGGDGGDDEGPVIRRPLFGGGGGQVAEKEQQQQPQRQPQQQQQRYNNDDFFSSGPTPTTTNTTTTNAAAIAPMMPTATVAPGSGGGGGGGGGGTAIPTAHHQLWDDDNDDNIGPSYTPQQEQQPGQSQLQRTAPTTADAILFGDES